MNKFNGIVPGCEEFIGIMYRAKAVAFYGTFTSGDLTTSIKSGKLSIEDEADFARSFPMRNR